MCVVYREGHLCRRAFLWWELLYVEFEAVVDCCHDVLLWNAGEESHQVVIEQEVWFMWQLL